MMSAANASNQDIRDAVTSRSVDGNWPDPPAPSAPSAVACVCLTAPGVSVELTVEQIMTNGGQYCGPEWGWVALQELHAYGHAFDTDQESWECLNRDVLYAQALAWHDEHLADADPDPTDPFGDSPAQRDPREWDSAPKA